MNLIVVLVFSPILLGIMYYLISRMRFWWVLMGQSALLVMAATVFYEVKQKDSISFVIGGWAKGKGIGIRLDDLSVTMFLLTAFLFLLFLTYEWEHLMGQKLYTFLLLTLEGLLFALFSSHDLFNFFVLMEVSTVLVTILIVYKKKSTAYYDGLIYLLINIIGMTFFLLGIGYVYRLYGVFDMDLLRTLVDSQPMSLDFILMYGLLLTGVTLKIGAIPVFAWLPRAHGSQGAPSVVSAILSGIYINIGFVYLIKFHQIFISVIDSRPLFLWLGVFTAFAGGILALVQEDIKKLLAYSTVSQIGFILMGLNLVDEQAYYGSIYHIVSHSVFKALLFLVAGVIIEWRGTRKLSEMRGIASSSPILAFCTLLGILGITGAPFFNGSIGKYLISKGSPFKWLEVILYLLNFLTILYLSKMGHLLWGKGEKKKLKLPRTLVLTTLGVFCLLGGLLAPFFLEFFFSYSLYIDQWAYFIKAVAYILTVIIGYLCYQKIFREAKILAFLREIDMPFNFIAFMVFTLFIIISTYGYLQIS